MVFKDHFSDHAADYARYRPDYPDSLFDFLGKAVKHHELAWDGGTGNGQAAVGLKVVQHYYRNIVGPFWPPERRYIDEKYETLPFPFVELPVPEMRMKVEWDLNEFTGYLQTWSATKRFQEKHDQNPLDLARPLLVKSWGDPGNRQTVYWPIHLRLGRMSAK